MGVGCKAVFGLRETPLYNPSPSNIFCLMGVGCAPRKNAVNNSPPSKMFWSKVSFFDAARQVAAIARLPWRAGRLR